MIFDTFTHIAGTIFDAVTALPGIVASSPVVPVLTVVAAAIIGAAIHVRAATR